MYTKLLQCPLPHKTAGSSAVCRRAEVQHLRCKAVRFGMSLAITRPAWSNFEDMIGYQIPNIEPEAIFCRNEARPGRKCLPSSKPIITHRSIFETRGPHGSPLLYLASGIAKGSKPQILTRKLQPVWEEYEFTSQCNAKVNHNIEYLNI